MLWENLRRNQCPSCGGDLSFNHSTHFCHCEEIECDFKISPKRFKEIAMEEDEPIFDGFCEDCGRKIPPRYRLCRSCERGEQ